MLDANLVLKPAGAQTSSAQSATGVDFGGPDVHPVTYVLNCTTVSGTGPTLNVKIQESDNNSTWRDAVAFPQISAAGVHRVTGKLDGRYRRYYSTVAGTTPSFTYSVYPELGGEYTKF